MKEWRALRPSMVSLPIPHFMAIAGLATITSVIQAYNLWIVGVVLTWYYDQVMCSFNKKETTTLWFFSGLFTSILGFPILLVAILPLLWLWDQELLDDRYAKLGEWLHNLSIMTTDLNIPTGTPLTGANAEIPGIFSSDSPLWIYYEDIVRELRWGFDATAKFIREPGVSTTPLDFSAKPALSSTAVYLKYRKYTEGARLSIMVVCLMICCFTLGALGIVMAMIGIMVMQMETATSTTACDERQRGVTFKSGIYRISNYLMGFEYSHGIGVSHEGVLHVPYHVINGKPLNHGKGRFYPYMVDIDRDLVTFGGPPKFGDPTSYEEIYVNCETMDSRTSYKVKPTWNGSSGTLAWPGVTRPGESGSPVYAIGENDSLTLVALAGRYVKDENALVTEFANVEQVKEEEDKNYIKIVTHPGSGKTRKIIPQLVREHLPMLKGKKIMITGPTRVVCKEMYEALKKEFQVGLNIKGSDGKRNHFASVQICAHRTALNMLALGDRAAKGVAMLMIDEAHVDDAATIMLRQFAKSQIGSGMKVVELSATLDGVTNDGSNFDILEKEIKDKETTGIIKEELEQGKRVMVFVPSIKGKIAQEIVKECKDHAPILLSRDTFEAGIASIADTDNRLILTTDIAECGINVPDLDVVVDTGKKFKYVEQGNIIHGADVGIDLAARTQRRGRVGRSKRGKYYYVKTGRELETPLMTSAQADANILLTGRAWSNGETNEWGLMLTDKQFRKWMTSEDLTPMEVLLTTDVHGIRLKSADIRKNWDKWKSEKGTYYTGCDKKTCKQCEGSYRFYDERAHDRLFNTIGKQAKQELD
nr:NS3-like protein [Wuhan aphid virus 2]